MLSGNFEASLPPLPPKNDTRRSSNGLPYVYDTPGTSAGRPRSPSPGPSSRRNLPYDRYVPARASFPELPNCYRPNSWRPGRSYYSRSPSPDRYENARESEADAWGRSVAWEPSSASPWSERRPLPPRPSSTFETPRREIIAERMFEPSDSWKLTHNDRSYRPEAGSPVDRYRWDSLEDRPTRGSFSPPYYAAGGDRYRPAYSTSPTYREPYPNSRSDSYRPNYDEEGPWDPRYSREPRPLSNSPRSYRPDPPYDTRVDSPFSAYQPGTGRSPDWVPPTASRSLSHSPVHSRKNTSYEESEARGRTSSPTNRPSHGTDARIAGEPPRKKFKSRSTSPPFDARPSNGLKNHLEPSNSRINQLISSRQDELMEMSISPASSESQPKANGVKVSPPYPSPPRSQEHNIPAAESLHKVTPPERQDYLHPIETTISSISTPEWKPPVHGRASSIASSIASSVPDEALSFQAPAPPAARPPNDVSMRITGKPALSLALPVLHPLSPSESTRTIDGLSTVPPDASALPNSVLSKPQTGISPSRLREPPPTPSSIVFPKPEVDEASPVFQSSPLSSPIPSDNMDIDEQPPPNIGHFPEVATAISAPDKIPTASEPPLGLRTQETLDTTSRATPDHTDAVSEHGDEVDELPRMSDATTLAEALRIVVMTRIQCDHQTREERVNPVLMANLSIAEPSPEEEKTQNRLFLDITEGKRSQSRIEKFAGAKACLVKRFSQRQAALTEKTQRLRAEYQTLHECWMAHCARLDSSAKAGHGPDDAVAATSSRTTRRSTAILGDAVRSDLEMEQIIASLGIDELTDPSHLAARNVARIPDMISVTHGQVDYHFDDTNNLVDDPVTFYDPRTGIDDWNEEEKEIFLEKFAAHPKQFGIIADHLPNKTASQCVTYYYLHKKQFIDFRKVLLRYAPGKRRRGGRRAAADKQKGNALLADIRKHDDEVSRNSASNGATTRRRRTVATTPVEVRKTALSRRTAAQFEQTPTSTPTPEPEARQRRRRNVRTVVQDEGEEEGNDADPKPVKRGRRGRKPKTPAVITNPEDLSPVPPVPDATFADPNDLSTRRKPPAVSVNWSDDDKSLFLALLAQHGDDFKRIAASMPNKTTIQASNYYKSNCAELELEKVAAQAPKRSPTPEISRDPWQDMSQFPGSGIMSPMAGTASVVNGGPLGLLPSNSVSSNYQLPSRNEERHFSGNSTSSVDVAPVPRSYSPSISRARPPANALPNDDLLSSNGRDDPSALSTFSKPSRSQHPLPQQTGISPHYRPSTTMQSSHSIAPALPNLSALGINLPMSSLPSSLQTTQDLVAYLEHCARQPQTDQ